MSADMTNETSVHRTGIHEIEMPAPTVWPVVLAFGSALMFTGLLTSASISVLGLILAVFGSVGWIREVLPREREIAVAIEPETVEIKTSRLLVERFPLAE